MTKLMRDLTTVLLALHIKRVKTATHYASPTRVVRVTEVGKWRKRGRALHFRITLGKPNYATRRFIKNAVKAGEPFPIKKLQLKLRRAP